MRTFQAVTTCNKAGWELYGRRMTESFREFWPHTVHLAVYAEGFNLENVSPRIHQRRLPLWLDDFKARHADNDAANGMRTGVYNYKFDAVKFANKVGAVITEFVMCGHDILIWIDADTVSHSRVTHSFLEWLMPEGAGIAWLDREHMYPECGFYMLNRRDPETDDAMRRWLALYESDQVFTLQEWHDSYVLQQVIEHSPVRTASLSGEFRDHSHPFANGPLGSCLDHLKGPRKQLGRSKKGDLRVPRQEAYWKAAQ
jgi:hypothetical protein